MIETIIISVFSGVMAGAVVDGAETVYRRIKKSYNEKNLSNEDKITKIIFDVFSSIVKREYDVDVDEISFIRKISEYSDNNKQHKMGFSMSDLFNVFREILDSSNVKLEREFSELFRRELIVQISRDQELSIYLMLSSSKWENHFLEESNFRQAEYDGLIDTIDKHTKNSHHVYSDMSIIDEVLYPFFIRMYNDCCSDYIMNLGYWLTNIYDQTSKQEKSVTIAKKLLDRQMNELTMSNIQKRIGCTYSIAIAKTDDKNKKKEWISYADLEFKNCDFYIHRWKETENDNYNVWFIEALYDSDYAAFVSNVADWKRKEKSIYESEYLEEIDKALQLHKEARALREGIKLMKGVLDDEKYEDNEWRLCKTISNLGGCYFRLGDYDKAIELQYESIEQEFIRNSSFGYSVKTYIVGAYIMKWKKESSAINVTKIIELEKMIDYSINYYSGKDNEKLEDAQNKKNELETLINTAE